MVAGYEPAAGWDQPAHGSCRPGMIELQRFAETEFGAVFLGCYVDRPRTGSTATSVHRDGRAIDPGFPDPVQRDRFFRTIVDHATALNLSMALVYRNGDHGGYRWRLPYRPAEAGYTPIGTFTKRGTWAHIERLTAGADDPRPIDQIIGNDPVPPRDADLIDLSSWNTITKYANLPEGVPIVHRVVANTGSIDERFASRMPTLSTRTDLFGGYVVLAPGKIVSQMRTYVDAMRPFWRDGAFTQLDVERWPDIGLISDVELDTAIRLHDEAFGPDRVAVYMNPYTTPDLWGQFVNNHPDVPRWVPGYRPEDHEKAERFGATIHQWTDSYRHPGFTAGVDANEIRNLTELRRIANIDQPEPPTPAPEDDPMPILIKPKAFAGALFTFDGHPVSPEAATALTKLHGDGLQIVEQDHPFWDAATADKMGADARRLYAEFVDARS